jgi:signal transduction histidine kinase
MRSFSPILPGDWLALSIRWLFMAALAIFAGLLGLMGDEAWPIIVGWIGINLISSVLRVGRWRPSRLDRLCVVVDAGFGLGLVGVTGWHASPMWWSLLAAATYAGLISGLRTGGQTLLAALILGSVLSTGFNHFSGWIFLEALMQAILVFVGALVLALPMRWVLSSLESWRAEEDQVLERQQLQDRQRVERISHLSAEINTLLNPELIFFQGLSLCLQSLGDSSMAGQQPTGTAYRFQDGQLALMASTKSRSEDESAHEVALDSGLWNELLVEGRSQLINSPASDTTLALLDLEEDWSEAILAPLKVGSSILGLLVVGHSAPAWYGQNERDVIDAIARQMGVAVNNALLYAGMVTERDRISEIQEEVRKKLARDLHDGPTQVVAAIAMRANFARRLMSRDQEKAEDELLKVEEMARRTTKEIRHMLFTLRPLILESQGLVAALNQLVDKTFETHEQLIYLEMDPDLDTSLGLERESVVFFIAEEAINNARKHAAAAHIWVRLLQEGDWFVLEVEDDGAGFNVGAVDRDYEQRGSLGMVNMRERAELVNGELQIESTEGVGTFVRLKVPMLPADQEPEGLFNAISDPNIDQDVDEYDDC